jgi:two-component system phosphate regulon sensor histidine kinase PhoR
MFTKIRNRIIFFFMALITAMTAALLIFIINHIKSYYLDIIRREMAEKINFVDLVIKQNPARYLAVTPRERQRSICELSGIIGLRITFVDPDGTVRADSDYENLGEMDNHRYRPEIMDALQNGTGESIRFSNTLRIEMFYLAKKSGGEIIRLAKPLIEVNESISQVRSYIFLAGGVLVMVSFFFIIMITRRITRPIYETMSFARDFSNGDYSRRIRNYSNDEIGTLQKALNKLADTAQDKINNLIEEQRRLETTIESIHDGIAVIGRDKHILVANGAFKSMLEINTFTEGKLFFEAIRNRSLNSHIEQAHATGQAASFEEELLNGRHCEIVINPIRGENLLQGTLIVLHDTTEKKKVDQMKTDLVSNMSHELKTPVTILKGYLETLEQHIKKSDLAGDLLKKALINVDRQASLINDILKLNRLETSRDFPMEWIDIPDIIRTCMDILHHKAQRKNVVIRFEADGGPVKIRGNRFLAEEVFFNIIDNAINYNHDGGAVDIFLKSGGGPVSVSIKDSGIGIPPDSIDRIFERFYRVDRSRSRATGGTGLGLSIVKHAAEILSWNVSVRSGDGGTVFTIEMWPYRATPDVYNSGSSK